MIKVISAVVVFLVVVTLVDVAHGEFYEDFDSNTASNNYVWNAGDMIVGNNGWQHLHNYWGAVGPLSSAEIRAADWGAGSTQGGAVPIVPSPDRPQWLSTVAVAGAARKITADKVGNSYTVSAMFDGRTMNEPYRLIVGDTAGTLNPSSTPSRYLVHVSITDIVVGLNHAGGWYYNSWDTGSWPYTQVNPTVDRWIQLKIDIDPDNHYAHAFIQDVDENGLHPEGWVDLGRFPNVGEAGIGLNLTGDSIIPFTPKAAGFGIGHSPFHDLGHVDNFHSGVSPWPGDFDQDGDVDGDDFLIWQKEFPTVTGAALLDGDADADGDVDGNDFLIWQNHFLSPTSPSKTPEPASLGLLALGGLLMLRRRVPTGRHGDM